jgi:hypothetical protein
MLVPAISFLSRWTGRSGAAARRKPTPPGRVCIPNIGPREQRRRRLGGILMFAVAAALIGAFSLFGVAPLWGLALFIPFWAGATGFFQAREKT